MNELMIIGFIGMTATAYYYWRRARYLDSLLNLTDVLISAMALKLAKLEAEAKGEQPATKGVVSVDLTGFIKPDPKGD